MEGERKFDDLPECQHCEDPKHKGTGALVHYHGGVEHNQPGNPPMLGLFGRLGLGRQGGFGGLQALFRRFKGGRGTTYPPIPRGLPGA